MPSYYKFKLIYHNFGHLKLEIFLGGLRIVKWVESNWRPYKSPICHKLIGKLATFTRSPMFHMGHDRLETHLQSVGSPICRVSDLLGILKLRKTKMHIPENDFILCKSVVYTTDFPNIR